jgi:hypothetical protein
MSESTRLTSSGPMTMIASPAPARSWEAGCAVRRDWPDGTHDLVAFRASPLRADEFIRRDRRYWRGAPLHPLTWTVVQVSRRDFDLHRGRLECRSPDCPTAASAPRPRQHVR